MGKLRLDWLVKRSFPFVTSPRTMALKASK